MSKRCTQTPKKKIVFFYIILLGNAPIIKSHMTADWEGHKYRVQSQKETSKLVLVRTDTQTVTPRLFDEEQISIPSNIFSIQS